MSTIPIRTLPAVVLLHLALAGNAQPVQQNYDSLPLKKPKLLQPIYVFPSPGIGKATLVHKRPRPTALPPPKQKFDELFTASTGVKPDSSFSSNFLGTHEIQLSDPLKNWQVHVYCSGTSTRRGPGLIAKQVFDDMDWQRGGQGILLKQSDTVGVFLTIRDPRSDKLLADWLSYLEPRYKIPDVARGGAQPYFIPYKDYALHGKLRDKYFDVVVSGQRWVSVILFGEKPVALFRSDYNNVTTGEAEDLFSPFLLIDKSLNEAEREEVMMLSMVTWLTTKTMGRSSYP